ncbi:MAG: hypothetical protein Q9167_005640 [Letrouitia subvulpina]
MAKGHLKAHVILHTDFKTYPTNVLDQLKGAVGCVWALGVSQNDVSKDVYEEITVDYPMAAARAFSSLASPFKLVYVSGEGATSSPGIFTPYFGKIKGHAETELSNLSAQQEYSSLKVYSLRPGAVDPKQHQEIHEWIPKGKGFKAVVSSPMLAVVRAVGPSLVSPTKDLGRVLTELAMGDGERLDGVFLITGASSGLGLELSTLLYSHNATIHLAARSEPSASAAISSIRSAHPSSTGNLHFLPLDLCDLSNVSSAAKSFLAREVRLDVLFLNAGVMIPPGEQKTKQGYELQLGVNCLGHFLFTKLLLPSLVRTKQEGNGLGRVVWLGSSAAEGFAPKHGVDMHALAAEMAEDGKPNYRPWTLYGRSKAGNILYAKELARRYSKANGIISVIQSINPGNLRTNLQRHTTGLQGRILSLFLHPPINGAYTELFAGLSPDVTVEKSGAWIIPWGRFGSLRKDLELAGKTTAEGGSGVSGEFWEWSEKQVEAYL